MAPQLAHGALAQFAQLAEFVGELGHGAPRRVQQGFHAGAALAGVGVAALGQLGADAALVDFREPVLERLDQRGAALGIVEQVVLQVGIAPHHPDVAQHFVQHARGPAGAALAAQVGQHPPRVLAKQAADDFPVGERRVVVGNLAQEGRGGRGQRGV